MKKIKKYTLVCICLLIANVLSASSAYQDAAKAYQAANYEQAIDLYESQLKLEREKGLESADLLYNLGNAYFRDKQIGKAILNYERAILIEPADEDICQNLAFARTKIEDKIVPVDPFFVQSWFEDIQNLQSSDAWAKLSIALFLVLVGSLSVFFFANKIGIKKIVFYLGLVSFVLLIFTNVFSYQQRSKIISRQTAIVISGAVSVKNSPDLTSKELFMLHAGSKVKIKKEDGNWVEIEIDNGNIGWIDNNNIEKI